MRNVLVLYHSRSGHTARIVRCLAAALEAEGARATAMTMMEGDREGVCWDEYDTVVVGAPVLYGTYDRIVWDFVSRFKGELDSRPNAFFNVSVVARTPIKATPEGNRYLQKFVERSSWKPRDLKCIAGKVDYPHWAWWQTFLIQLIMKMTHGPTDPTAVIDYTDYEDIKAYARHILTLA